MATFRARFREQGRLTAKFGQVQIIHVHDHDYFPGPYTVTPRVESQLLETQDLLMREDVDIHGIPYDETSNEYGTTVRIGEGEFGPFDLQSKSIEPQAEELAVRPDPGYYGLSLVRVGAIDIPSNYGLITWNGSYLTVS